jgi:hypothetical protein
VCYGIGDTCSAPAAAQRDAVLRHCATAGHRLLP